jgi:predicted DCC family thiol-disulfide oxidoreductase YuxK
MPKEVRLAGWIFLSLLYVGQGIVLHRAEGDMFVLEDSALWTLVVAHCGFGLLVALSMLRPGVWLLMLGVQTYLIFSPLEMAWVAWLLPLHLFVFDPAWIRPTSRDKVVITFYDGHCGLCHRAVRFVLSEDRSNRATDFAPLGGDTFQELVGDIPDLPDSMVVLREDGTLLLRSTAALFLMRRLGGLWRVVAWCLVLLPRLLRDGFYNFVAGRRRRWFAPPEDVCPLIPLRFQGRFLDIGS